jgi:hypothetical protein
MRMLAGGSFQEQAGGNEVEDILVHIWFIVAAITFAVGWVWVFFKLQLHKVSK